MKHRFNVEVVANPTTSPDYVEWYLRTLLTAAIKWNEEVNILTTDDLVVELAKPAGDPRQVNEVYDGGLLDITGAEGAEIVISPGPRDTLVLHVNTEHGARLRICRIEGAVTLTDGRVNTIKEDT